MSRGLRRREFLSGALAGAGWFVIAACASPIVGSGKRDLRAPAGFAFPQGIASADPGPDSIVLWTRVEPKNGETRIALRVEVSADRNFDELVVDEAVEAVAENDYTVRAVIEELDADTRYYYRFALAEGGSPTGRTRTAPAEDADRDVRFAFACCQNYEQGLFTGYRRMIADDTAADEDEQIDFVLHLGDFIYEVIGLADVRSIPAFRATHRDGGWIGPTRRPSTTTATSTRPTCRTPTCRRRARWPFVCTWDDHEFTNDAWQSRATYDAPDTPAQTRKLAANQAWFEFIPARLDGTVGVRSVLQRAQDFRPATVVDAPFTGVDSSGLDREPNNIAAISSLTIYRSLRFGRHVDLLVTDTRTYRSDHAMPEEVAKEQFGSNKMLPVEIVNICDAGRSFAEGRPPTQLEGPKGSFPNPRRWAPPGTILGGRQKRWFKQTMAESTATWKLWGNSVPLLPIRFDLQSISEDRKESMFSTDTWDGYAHERSELLGFLQKRVPNFVSITGDNHMHFAGQVMRDFDAETVEPIAAEFAIGALSATSLYRLFTLIGGKELEQFVRYDARPFGGDESEVELLNLTLTGGVRAGLTAGTTGDLAAAEAQRNPKHARHLRYIDSNGNGYGLAHVAADQVTVRIVTIETPIGESKRDGAEKIRTARFEVPARELGEASEFLGPFFDSGKPPFPLG